MKVAVVTVSLLASVTNALTLSTLSTPIKVAKQVDAGCAAPVYLNASSNIWKDYTLHPNSIYRNWVAVATGLIDDAELKKKAQKVQDTGTFVWIEGKEQISRIEEVLAVVPCNHVLGLVISGFPYKTCSSSAEDAGSYSQDFIDPIAEIIKRHSNTAFALIIEPNIVGTAALASQSSCDQFKSAYRANIPYALKAFNLQNVILYLDGAHGGVFGWKEAQKTGAEELINAWKAAEQPSQFRGLAINVGSYNSWNLTPGESFKGENTCYDLLNPARNEQRYLDVLNKEISKTNMPFHSIMDTSRSGVQGIREYWDDWCNVNGAAFGRAPTDKTGDARLDAFVWAKWGGVSDGISDSNSGMYDPNCGKLDAFKPMPDRGEWSQAYFEMLLKEWKSSNQPVLKRKIELATCG